VVYYPALLVDEAMHGRFYALGQPASAQPPT